MLRPSGETSSAHEDAGARPVMRLSEAIRLGATMKPQGFGRILSADWDATCAIGAAIDALDLWDQSRDPKFEELYGATGSRGGRATKVIDLPRDWQLALATHASCPACDGVSGTLGGLIPHLNDCHRWTRERIADFVELHEGIPTVERPDTQASRDATPVAGKSKTQSMEMNHV